MSPYEMVSQFHERFGEKNPDQPSEMGFDVALNRTLFKIEELVELMAASSNNQPQLLQAIAAMHQAVDHANKKVGVIDESNEVDFVGQIDALIDLLYFTYGSFSLLGVDPQPFFDIVHQANMGKLFPDGQARYHPVTGKILKPENWQEDYSPEVKIKKELLRQRKMKNTKRTEKPV